jgi:hypothetical protein
MRNTATMGDDGAVDLVTDARELERRDIDVAARIDVVAGLLRQVDDVRARAGRIHTALEAIPGEVERVELAAEDARGREAEARRELTDAEDRLEKVGHSRRAGEDAKANAERAVRRAMVAVADAAAAAERTEGHLRDIANEAVALGAEGEVLATEARNVAEAVARVPRLSDSGRTAPGVSLGEIEEWGARAHAGLFVVRDGLESERERIVLEANSLAAAALGEQGGSTSVALVRKRLEASLLGL